VKTHYGGEGGGHYYHIVLIFKGPVFELQPCHTIIDFQNIFAYYGESKPKEVKCQKNYIFYFIWCDVRIYLCKTNVRCNVLKNANIFKKWLKLFMKFVISTKHCDSIWLE